MRVQLYAGWGVLGPAAHTAGWAPGDVNDSKDGAAGWILWISLAIMLGESFTSLSLLCISSLRDNYLRYRCVALLAWPTN